MKRNLSLIRPSLKKYRNVILGVTAFLMLTAYPGYLLSKDTSAFFVIERLYRAGEEIFVNYNIDLNVYDNTTSKDQQSFTEKIISEINKAEKDIYIAIYSFNIESIRDALIDAKDRGVNVVIYYPYEKSFAFDGFLGDFKSKLEVKYVGKYDSDEDYYHMHHKFMIVDPELDKRVLLTGPWNWSHYQQDLDPNILIETHDEEIIKSYMAETSRIERGLSGYNKFRDFTYLPWGKKIYYKNGDILEIWWSPGRKYNSIESRVIDLINESKERIDIGITIFDSRRISNKLIQKAREGIKIRLIVDINTKYDENSNIIWLEEMIKEYNLQDNFKIFDGGSLPADENSEYTIFHHHNMIVDNKITFTSTANWTHGGYFLNDENSFVIYSEKITSKFQNIFDNYLQYINQY